jgi:hypothetical protein
MAGMDEPTAVEGSRPELRDGEFVFVAVTAERAGELAAEALIREEEATTVVLRREDADAAGLPYDFVAAWITLTAATALDDVGVTAAFSAVLAAAGISCNVLAGVHHDHILVPAERAEEALAALRSQAA